MMEKGMLTPKSNDSIVEARFTGAFGQPDGFGSVLHIRIARSGELCLTLTYNNHVDGIERTWSITLDNYQRLDLYDLIGGHNTCFCEVIKDTRQKCHIDVR